MIRSCPLFEEISNKGSVLTENRKEQWANAKLGHNVNIDIFNMLNNIFKDIKVSFERYMMQRCKLVHEARNPGICCRLF